MRSAAKVEKHVEDVLAEHCRFDVPAVIFTPEQLRAGVRPTRRGIPAAGLRRRTATSVATSPSSRSATPRPGDVAKQIDAWDEEGESATVIGRAVHIWLNRTTHEAKFFGAFKKALAPGTNRDLKVVRTLDEKWGA